MSLKYSINIVVLLFFLCGGSSNFLLHVVNAAPAQHHLSIGVEGDMPTLIVTSGEISLKPKLSSDAMGVGMPIWGTAYNKRPTTKRSATTSMTTTTTTMHMPMPSVDKTSTNGMPTNVDPLDTTKAIPTPPTPPTPPTATSTDIVTTIAVAAIETPKSELSLTEKKELPTSIWRGEINEQEEEPTTTTTTVTTAKSATIVTMARTTIAATTATTTIPTTSSSSTTTEIETTMTTTELPKIQKNSPTKTSETIQFLASTKYVPRTTRTTRPTPTPTVFTSTTPTPKASASATTIPTNIPELIKTVASNDTVIYTVSNSQENLKKAKLTNDNKVTEGTEETEEKPMDYVVGQNIITADTNNQLPPTANKMLMLPTTTTAPTTSALSTSTTTSTSSSSSSIETSSATTTTIFNEQIIETTTRTPELSIKTLSQELPKMLVHDNDNDDDEGNGDGDKELNSFMVAYDDEVITIDRSEEIRPEPVSEQKATTQQVMTIEKNEKPIEAATTTTTAAATTTTTVEAAASVTTSDKLLIGNIIQSDLELMAAPTIETTLKSTAAQPHTLMPVRNGYLGPIFMAEKTFSVVHPLKRPHAEPLRHHHESSIADQLRDGRLVEIIAPTALLEQIPLSSTQPTTTTTTTTTATATVKATKQLRHSNRPFAIDDGEQARAPVMSTTVFQVPETQTSTTHQPQRMNGEGVAAIAGLQTESKISDIQIEVYDSTVDSIVASTNFKDADSFYSLPLDTTVGTTRPPLSPVTQERFTQYVIDRADVFAQESSSSPLSIVNGGAGGASVGGGGKPEPAAIEIHINVSEAFGNESEDLEFSYHQPENNNNNNNINNGLQQQQQQQQQTIKSKKSFSSITSQSTGSSNSKEHSDEILVVEIIDTGDNMTENSASSEHINPIFTFRADNDAADVELKDVKYLPSAGEAIAHPTQLADELFLADVKGSVIAETDDGYAAPPPPPPPPPPRKPSIDRDSDTIFYISNTEVKVGETLPTVNTNINQQETKQQQQQQQEQQEQQDQQQMLRKTRLENQFFPVNYAPRHTQSGERHRYEEDIILSSLHDTSDTLKIFRGHGLGDGAPPLDVTYVGESVIEVEQSGIAPISTSTSQPDVIIQPAILPEMSIGVPVIGELPPQIELKEIDFMPGELSHNSDRSGLIFENEVDEPADGNSIGGAVYYSGSDPDTGDHIVESSIQYGGDLIDDGAGGGFDGVEGSYPFENPASMHHIAKGKHYTVNHGVSNLRKDELNVELLGPAVASVFAMEGTTIIPNETNTTQRIHDNGNGNGNGNETVVFATSNTTQPERMGNATAYSEEEPSNLTKAVQENGYLNLFALSVGLVIITLPVLVFVAVFCAVRYYVNYKRCRAMDQELQNSEEDGAGTDANALVGADGNANGTGKDALCTISVVNESEFHPNTPSELSALYCTNSTIMKSRKSKSKSNATTTNNCNIKKKIKKTKAIVHSSSSQMNESVQLETVPQSQLLSVSVPPEIEPQYLGPSGSITKMTLRNNHLIVVTEERNDISRDARETKIHHEKRGIFVVEVARGIDTAPHIMSESRGVGVGVSVGVGGSGGGVTNATTTVETTELPFASEQHTTSNGLSSVLTRAEQSSLVPSLHDAAVQIHAPPIDVVAIAEELQRSLHLIEEVEEESTAALKMATEYIESNEDGNDDEVQCIPAQQPNTGLSQSDLSSASSSDSNKRYSYGNQELYFIEQPGYATTSPTTNQLVASQENNTDTTQDDNDRKSGNGSSLEHSSANAKQTDLEGNDKQTKQSTNARNDLRTSDITGQHNKHENAIELNGHVTAKLDNPQEMDEPNEMNSELPVEPVESYEASAAAPPAAFSDANGSDNTPAENETEAEGEAEAEAETETYDSIMSLPDPPSTEEIKQLNDFTLIESNQLDSLPPPPPPSLLLVTSDEADTVTNGEHTTAHKIHEEPESNEEENKDIKEEILTNGNPPPPPPPPQQLATTIETITSDKLFTAAVSIPPASIATDLGQRKVLPSTLTPPASPPASPIASTLLSSSPPTIYGIANGGIHAPLTAVAVDVNGS